MIAPYNPTENARPTVANNERLTREEVVRTHSTNHAPSLSLSERIHAASQQIVAQHPLAVLAVSGTIGIVLGCLVKRRGSQ
ncbi:hypothetical protein [Planctomycetes bacterium K23_9]|uniref:DUF883 domain-containing protein n=1 Tax=Stieleria marina TaxID=1930275 RepID=A0A517NXT6_9BACT|nr:hypothetical protein K239x_39490 [Planctomycetes bacterium K23_9]